MSPISTRAPSATPSIRRAYDFAKWATIYRDQTLNNQPEVFAEAKRLDAEILSISKKISNLIGRLYDQIKTMTFKKERLVLTKEKIRTQVQDLGGKDIDEKALIERIQRVVARVEQVPKDAQRPPEPMALPSNQHLNPLNRLSSPSTRPSVWVRVLLGMVPPSRRPSNQHF